MIKTQSDSMTQTILTPSDEIITFYPVKSIPTSFALNFDMCTEGCNNAWEAHGLICAEAEIEDAEVHNVEYIGLAPNGWPQLRVTFSSLEVAKVYTAVYLGIGIDPWTIDTDEEVGDYISSGEFV